MPISSWSMDDQAIKPLLIFDPSASITSSDRNCIYVATTIPQRNKEKKEGSQICTYPIHFGDLLEGVKLIIDVFWSNVQDQRRPKGVRCIAWLA